MASSVRIQPQKKPLFSYTYNIKLGLTLPSSKTPLDVEVIGGPVEFDYTGATLYPKFTLTFQVLAKDITNVISNRRDLTGILTITTNRYQIKPPPETGKSTDANTSNEPKPELVETKPLVKMECLVMLDPNTIPHNVPEDAIHDSETMINSKNEETGGNDVTTSDPRVGAVYKISAWIYDLSTLRLFKNVRVNAIAAGADVPTALMYVLSKANPFIDKMVVDPPSNGSAYADIKMPFTDFRNALASLQQRYGIYTTGLLVYSFFKTLYVLDKYAYTHDSHKDNYKEVSIEITDATLIQTTTPTTIEIDEAKKSITYKTTHFLKEVDVSMDVVEYAGTHILMGNLNLSLNALQYNPQTKQWSSNDPALLIKRHADSHTQTGDRVLYDYDELNSPYGLSTKMREEIGSFTMNIPLSVVDLASFPPNQIVNVTVVGDRKKKQKYDGRYRVELVSVYWLRDSSDSHRGQMRCTAVITLGKEPIKSV